MITFASVAVGDAYGPEYVYPLMAGIHRHTDKNVRFLLFSDSPERFPGVETVDVSGFLERYTPPTSQGWWGCMSIFDPATPADFLIYTDVDNVIVGDLDPLIDEVSQHDFSAHREWGANWTEMAKGMLAFRVGGDGATAIWNAWSYPKPRAIIGEASQGQDQAFIELALRNDGIPWHYVPDEWIASYKLLTRQGVYSDENVARRPLRAKRGTWDEARILCMHGEPKAGEVIGHQLPGWEVIKREWMA